MSEASALLVPLRSNGSALLNGKPIESVRQRLKLASLSFDHIYLEEGTYRLSAGPGGSWGVSAPPPGEAPPRWQTAALRGAEQRRPVTVAVGREEAPGVPARRTGTAVRSRTSVSWAATLHPFQAEFPAGTDWISFAPTRAPDGDMARLSDRWRRADDRNRALERALPERFVRSAVTRHANRDLGFAAQYGLAVSADPVHGRVVAERFRDDNGWKLRGFAVPLLFPDVSDWDWEDVADLRRDKHMARFRAILSEAGQEAVAEAAGGDVEAAVKRAYRRHLVEAQDAVAGAGTVAHSTLQGFVIGGEAGFAAAGLTSPIGIVAGAALGALPGAILNVCDVIQPCKARGWTTLRQRADSQFTPVG